MTIPDAAALIAKLDNEHDTGPVHPHSLSPEAHFNGILQFFGTVFVCVCVRPDRHRATPNV
jgi:hypothetical protein